MSCTTTVKYRKTTCDYNCLLHVFQQTAHEYQFTIKCDTQLTDSKNNNDFKSVIKQIMPTDHSVYFSCARLSVDVNLVEICRIHFKIRMDEYDKKMVKLATLRCTEASTQQIG